MAEMRSEPLEPEPDSTGVGMVKLIVLPFCTLTLLPRIHLKVLVNFTVYTP